MARRRVNKTFLIGLTVAVLAGLSALAVLAYLKNRVDVPAFIKAGDDAMKAADSAASLTERLEYLRKANACYGRALGKDRRNVELTVKLGDVLYELTAFDPDPEQIRRNLGMWEQALQVNPTYLPALQRVFQWSLDRVELDPRADSFFDLQKRAAALAAADPGNLRAKAFEQIAIVGAWLGGVSGRDAVPPHIVEALGQLVKLRKDKPDADVPADIRAALRELADLQKKKPQDLNFPPSLVKALDELAQKPTEPLSKPMVDRFLEIAGLLSEKAAPSQVMAALDELARLQQKVPDEAAIPRFRVLSRLQIAREQIVANNLDGPDGARAQLAEAEKPFTEAMKTQGDNPIMLWRYYQILDNIRQTRNAMDRGSTLAEQRLELRKTLPMIQKAAEKIRPDHRDYVQVRLAAAEAAARVGDYAQAEKSERQLLAEMQSRAPGATTRPGAETRPADPSHPGPLQVRLALARILRTGPGRQRASIAEAIDLLRSPYADEPTLKGYRALLLRGLEIQRLSTLVDLRLGLCAMSDLRDRAMLKDAIDQDYARLTSIVPDREVPEMGKLRAQILLLEPNATPRVLRLQDAAEILQKASNRMDQRGRVDRELSLQLAQVFQELGQRGNVREQLSKVVEAFPEDVASRKSLVRELLLQHVFADTAVAPSGGRLRAIQMGADSHLKVLEQQTKGDLEVLADRLQLMMGKGQVDQARKQVRDMPEGTDAERIAKARCVSVTEGADAAEKMLLPIAAAERQRSGGAYDANRLLIVLYEVRGDRDKAEGIISEIAQRNPEDVTWREALSRIRLRPETRPSGDEDLGGTADDVALYKKYEALLSQKKDDEALALLLAAEKQQATGQRLEIIFEHAAQRGNWDMAEQYAAKLAKLNWDRADGLFYRVRIDMARNRLDAAMRGALELTRRQDYLARNWAILGRVQLTLGQFTEARDNFLKALERDPNELDALIGIVVCYRELDQPALAEKYIELGSRHPRAGSLFVAESKRLREHQRAQKEQKDPASFTAEREKEASEHPEDSGAAVALAQNYLLVAEDIMKKTGDPAQDRPRAEKVLANAIKVLQQVRDKWPDEPWGYRLSAAISWRMGNRDEGLSFLKQWAARDAWKSRPEPLRVLANYYLYQMKDPARAEQAMLEAIRIAPALRSELVQFYLQTREPEKAIEMLTRMVDQTKDPALRFQLIETQADFGRLKDAEAQVKQAVADHPGEPLWLLLQGMVKLKQNDLKSAEACLQQARAADPEQTREPAFYNLVDAQIKADRGDVAGAIVSLRRVLEYSPSNGNARYLLADWLRKSGRPQEAAQELEVLVHQAGSNPIPQAWTELLGYYIADSQWSQAERILEEARNRTSPDDPRWRREEASIWLARGDLNRALAVIEPGIVLANGSYDGQALKLKIEILLKARQYERAVETIDGVLGRLTASPDYWMYMYRGQALKELGRMDEAGKSFDSALAAAEDMPGDVVSALCQTMVDAMGEPWAADRLDSRVRHRWCIPLLQICARASDLKRGATVADRVLSGAYSELSLEQRLVAVREASRFYGQAALADPSLMDRAELAANRYLQELEAQKAKPLYQIVPLNNLASLYSDHPSRPDPAKALAYAERARKIMEQAGLNEPGVLDTYAWALIQNKRIDEATGILRNLILQQPLPEAYYHLGEAQRRQAQWDTAEDSFKQALAQLEAARQRGAVVDSTLRAKVEAAIEQVKQGRSKALQAQKAP